ncbi:MAG TPA: GNAT family N-acetyltransferase [Burkholderiales bacterium]|nr:GNAT family N-acetyltransferase [Burkholderiales bacterium]
MPPFSPRYALRAARQNANVRPHWSVARTDCLAAGNPGGFTVNSSNNAVAIYEKLGFVRTAPMQNKDGVLYNPMATNHAV